MFKLIVSDIEGCVSPGKGHYFDHHSISKLLDYNKKAEMNHVLLPLTLITGRSVRSMRFLK